MSKAIYGLREAPRLWQKERDQKLRELEFRYNDKLAHLVQSHIHPSLWFIAEGAVNEHNWIPPFDHSLRSDEWTAQLHQHRILGYVGLYVDDLLIAGHRSLSDTVIKAVQNVWKTSHPEHLGPDPDCVPEMILPQRHAIPVVLQLQEESDSEELIHLALDNHFQELLKSLPCSCHHLHPPHHRVAEEAQQPMQRSIHVNGHP